MKCHQCLLRLDPQWRSPAPRGAIRSLHGPRRFAPTPRSPSPASSCAAGRRAVRTFRRKDLPFDAVARDRVLLGVMGSPDVRQIDGLGGADPLTSKVAIVGRGRDGIDLDFLFAQVLIDEARVDVTPNCGNMLAGVGPFALETRARAAAGRRDNACGSSLATPEWSAT